MTVLKVAAWIYGVPVIGVCAYLAAADIFDAVATWWTKR